MTKAARLIEAVAFDEPTGTTDAFGGTSEAWTERHTCRAQWLYGKGDEGVQAAREAGRKAYKITAIGGPDGISILALMGLERVPMEEPL